MDSAPFVTESQGLPRIYLAFSPPPSEKASAGADRVVEGEGVAGEEAGKNAAGRVRGVAEMALDIRSMWIVFEGS